MMARTVVRRWVVSSCRHTLTSRPDRYSCTEANRTRELGVFFGPASTFRFSSHTRLLRSRPELVPARISVRGHADHTPNPLAGTRGFGNEPLLQSHTPHVGTGLHQHGTLLALRSHGTPSVSPDLRSSRPNVHLRSLTTGIFQPHSEDSVPIFGWFFFFTTCRHESSKLKRPSLGA